MGGTWFRFNFMNPLSLVVCRQWVVIVIRCEPLISTTLFVFMGPKYGGTLLHVGPDHVNYCAGILFLLCYFHIRSFIARFSELHAQPYMALLPLNRANKWEPIYFLSQTSDSMLDRNFQLNLYLLKTKTWGGSYKI